MAPKEGEQKAGKSRAEKKPVKTKAEKKPVKEGKSKKRAKSTETYKIYIYKVLKQVAFLVSLELFFGFVFFVSVFLCATWRPKKCGSGCFIDFFTRKKFFPRRFTFLPLTSTKDDIERSYVIWSGR
jgi:hypothetical protein